MHLRDCEVVNYNSGAGGSNALGDNAGVVLLEGCLFDGSGGRASRRPEDMGNAMDLRADAWLYARECQFVNNEDIVRATIPTVFDRCTALNTRGPLYGVISYPEGHIFLRESDSLVSNAVRASGPPPRAFSTATDDRAFVDYLLDPSKPIDDDSKQLASALQLTHRLPYWIGLIRDSDAQVRDLAKERLAALADIQVSLPADGPKEGETLADLGAMFNIEQEYARLMNWFDVNRARLRWDEAGSRYRLEGANE
jgi:hypothetical protein